MLRNLKTKKTATKKRGKEPNYTLDLDKVFQFYVRLRDAMPGGYTRCISCGRILPFDQMQAGHYYSRSHKTTRWSEDNVNSECIWDNCYNGDHLIGYRKNLVKKLGLQKVQYLDVVHSQTRKWSDFEIIELVKHYGEKVMQLSEQKGIHVSNEVQAIIRRYAKK